MDRSGDGTVGALCAPWSGNLDPTEPYPKMAVSRSVALRFRCVGRTLRATGLPTELVQPFCFAGRRHENSEIDRSMTTHGVYSVHHGRLIWIPPSHTPKWRFQGALPCGFGAWDAPYGPRGFQWSWFSPSASPGEGMRMVRWIAQVTARWVHSVHHGRAAPPFKCPKTPPIFLDYPSAGKYRRVRG